MSRCEQCGYWWADCDEEGESISLPYCHYVGPDEWAPCAQDGYEEEPTFEEYGAPYDYQEF